MLVYRCGSMHCVYPRWKSRYQYQGLSMTFARAQSTNSWKACQGLGSRCWNDGMHSPWFFKVVIIISHWDVHVCDHLHELAWVC